MARPKRDDWPGARHHVMNRGARREPLFFTDRHCAEFTGLLSELPTRFGVLIHAYALMPNHFHLLVESARGELSRGMAFLGSRYAAWLNSAHENWDGPVFRGRYKSKTIVRGEHWHHLPVYLHLNPVSAGIVADIEQSRWTSHGAYAGTEPAPNWLTVDDLLAGFGTHEGYRDYVREFQLGRTLAPAGFERSVFTPYARPVEREDEPSPQRPNTPTPESVLQAVATKIGVEIDDLRSVRRGRTGNTPKKLAAYWLVMGAGLSNIRAASILQMHPVRVSQTIRELREKMAVDTDFARLVGEIEKIFIASA